MQLPATTVAYPSFTNHVLELGIKLSEKEALAWDYK
jgi:hypothetical protein